MGLRLDRSLLLPAEGRAYPECSESGDTFGFLCRPIPNRDCKTYCDAEVSGDGSTVGSEKAIDGELGLSCSIGEVESRETGMEGVKERSLERKSHGRGANSLHLAWQMSPHSSQRRAERLTGMWQSLHSTCLLKVVLTKLCDAMLLLVLAMDAVGSAW